MSFVVAAPEWVAAAATDLANIGSAIGAANTAAVAPTTGVIAAGADEVSAAIAALFGSHAQAYQALSAQAAQFHAQFVQVLNAGAAAYASAEAANASPLQATLQSVGQEALNVVNAPTPRRCWVDRSSATVPMRRRPAVAARPGGSCTATAGPGRTAVRVKPAVRVGRGSDRQRRSRR